MKSGRSGLLLSAAFIPAAALRGAAGLSALALMCGTAYAQDAAVDAAPAEAGEAIVVTGSRIARPDLDSTVPVASFRTEDLQRDAAVNIMDSLSELPQVGIGNSRTNSNFLTSGTGVSTINLRNLGNSRTLTLVNGRRFVSGFAGDSAVDVNNIPTDFIERVDVVTGGQSAVYGSDAIAGVVNFILKDEFEGIRARAQYNITDRADNPRYFMSITGGTKFGADDRGSIIVNYSYDKDKGLYSRDRAISAEDCSGLICGPAAYSVFSPQGQFYLTNGSTTGAGDIYSFDTDNNLIAGQGPGFNRNGVRRIATPVERHLVSAIAKYDVTDSIELYAEGTYAKVRSNAALEPSAIALSTIVGVGDDAASALASPDAPGIGIDNPFIPAQLAAIIAARNSDADPTNDVTSISARRRFNEVFDRSNRASRDTWRAVAGVRGDITDKWGFDVSYVFGRVTDKNSSEDVDVRRLANALDATTINGQIVCRSEAARLDGCVPINLFGYNTASPEASAYVQAVVPKSEVITNTQHVVNATITGSFAALPAGDIGVAFGGEYRKESVVDDLDILTNTGGNSGNQIPDFSGKFDVWEAFGEINVPLLADMKFVNYLGLTGQARYSHYSTVGDVFSWNVGAEYSPVDGVRLRGVYAKANRAPNNSELFSPASETFATVNDPCDGTTATNNLNGYGDACRAIPAIAAAIANSGTFQYSLADIQSINGFVGGNTTLNEETAETYTLGAVFTPRFVPGLSVTVDYFNITVDDAIATTGRETSIEQCVLTGLDVFCNNVIRNGSTGYVTTVNDQLINVAQRKTSGIDLGVRYSRPLGLAENDTISLQANYSYLINFDIQPNPSAPVEHFDGTVGFSKHRASGRIVYGVNDVSFSWQLNYMSGADAIENFTNANPDVVALNKVDSYLYHDVQLRVDVMDKKAAFYFGIDNLFDKKPPFLPGTPFTISPTGTETAADVYDPFGRRFYAGFQFNF